VPDRLDEMKSGGMGTPTNSSTPLDLNREIWAVKSLVPFE
jgi:hypothetical protein